MNFSLSHKNAILRVAGFAPKVKQIPGSEITTVQMLEHGPKDHLTQFTGDQLQAMNFLWLDLEKQSSLERHVNALLRMHGNSLTTTLLNAKHGLTGVFTGIAPI